MLLQLVLLALVSCAYSQVTTPPRPIGFVYNNGNPYAKVHVDIYIDLICPDSKEAWPHIIEMANYYGPDNVRLTVHIFPLPYHQNGFYASRATFVVHHLTGGNHTFDWIGKILVHEISNLGDSVFHDNSDADLLQLFSTYATDLGLNATALLEKVDRRNYNVYEAKARAMWKHACVLGVGGTPTYLVNGVIHPNVLQSWGLPEWRAFIDPLLQPDVFDEIDGIVTGPVTGVTPPSTCPSGNSGSTTLPNILFSVSIFIVASLAIYL